MIIPCTCFPIDSRRPAVRAPCRPSSPSQCHRKRQMRHCDISECHGFDIPCECLLRSKGLLATSSYVAQRGSCSPWRSTYLPVWQRYSDKSAKRVALPCSCATRVSERQKRHERKGQLYLHRSITCVALAFYAKLAGTCRVSHLGRSLGVTGDHANG